jgi:hypothetical protein
MKNWVSPVPMRCENQAEEVMLNATTRRPDTSGTNIDVQILHRQNWLNASSQSKYCDKEPALIVMDYAFEQVYETIDCLLNRLKKDILLNGISF